MNKIATLCLPLLIGSAQAQSLLTEDGKLYSNVPQTSEFFGIGLCIDGNTAIAGAPGHDSSGQGMFFGAGFLLERSSMTGPWATQPQIFSPPAGTMSTFAGSPSSISGDVALVGGHGYSLYAGRADIWERASPGGAWAHVQTLPLPGDGIVTNDEFGESVSVDASGGLVGATLVVGAHQPGIGTGMAFVYERGVAWMRTAELHTIPGVNLGHDDLFGISVAQSSGTIVVGAPNHDPGGLPHAGAAFVFVLNGGTWVLEAKLTANDSTAGQYFGGAVSLDGDTAVITTRPDVDAIDIPPPVRSSSAYVFQRNGTVWTQQGRVVAPDGYGQDDYGISVSLSGDHFLVGAPWAYGLGSTPPKCGAAYLYERSGLFWGLLAKLVPSDGVDHDLFGVSVAIDGTTVLVGALFDDDNGMIASGSVYDFGTVLNPSIGTPFCFGVGCPCGNDTPTSGCVNSTGSGALLSGAGSTSVGLDDLLLTTTGCPPSNSGLYFMGADPFAPINVGDGLGCTGGLFRYFPGTVDASGVFILTNPIANAPAGQIQAGDTRHFQSWTRDVLCGPPPSPCPSPCGNNSNLSNAYSVVFTP